MASVEWIVAAGGVYLAIGLPFALLFVWRGVERVDPAAAGGTLGFRLLILPGAVVLWPWLLRRWAGGLRRPAPPRDAHRLAARPEERPGERT